MPRRESNALSLYERPDLSPYQVHLTRNSNADDKFTAYENLVSILVEGEIKGSNTKKGFIKGPHRAACFMDVPLASLKYVLNESNTNPDSPRYEAYGIIVTKAYAYRRGYRPVLSCLTKS